MATRPAEHPEFSRGGQEFNANLSKARILRHLNLTDWQFFSDGGYGTFGKREEGRDPLRDAPRSGFLPGHFLCGDAYPAVRR